MRTKYPSLRTFVSQFGTIARRSNLRRLAVVGAIVASAYCQFNAAIADSLNLPPQIVNFAASQSDVNVWVVSGTVIDDNIGSITVELGGYLFDGVDLCPAPDGSFSYSFYMLPGQFAYVSAIAYASDGDVYSEPAELMIFGF